MASDPRAVREALREEGWRRIAIKPAPPPAALGSSPDHGVRDLPDLSIRIEHKGARAVRIGAHAHLAEINEALMLDRDAAHGYRLALPAGAGLWLAPGDVVDVRATAFRGARLLYGQRGLIDGPLDEAVSHKED